MRPNLKMKTPKAKPVKKRIGVGVDDDVYDLAAKHLKSVGASDEDRFDLAYQIQEVIEGFMVTRFP